jgi:[acyl-carrier-protein] S-malonyltransferase
MAIAWVFPGQGSQVVAMGRDVYQQVPAARDIFEQADATLGINLAQMCFEGPPEVLTATQHAQPALLTCSVALLRALAALAPAGAAHLRPQLVAGHSLGEYSALVAAEALDFPTALRMVRRRGELMAEANEGTMAAVMGLHEEVLETLCHEVSQQTGDAVVIANYNAPDQLVISGGMQAVQEASRRAKEQGARRVMPLNVSAAFHSPLMAKAAEGMQQVIAAAHIADLQVPLVANVTATAITRADEVRHELVTQVISSVRWVESVQRMAAEGSTTFVEIGPGTVLTGLIKRIVPGVRLVNLRTTEDVRALAEHEALTTA